MATSREYITNKNTFYSRYKSDWSLTYNAYIGGVEWRNGRYLKQYQIDLQTPTEEIRTYEVSSDNNIISKGKSIVHHSISAKQADTGTFADTGNFYGEKLANVPLFPYVRLYVSEYNAILFNKVPTRKCGEEGSVISDMADVFMRDVDGEGNSINEFWSQVDTMTTVYGVCWVSCIKPIGGEYPLWQLHKPTDVVNWTYGYNQEGKNELRKIAILINQNEEAKVYRIFTNEEIQTVWIPNDDEMELDIEGAVFEDGAYIISRPNELGYIPIRPIYQSMKVYDGIGHTPMFDIAQIQRSVYNYAGELYSAITYGAHPVTIVDERTSEINGGQIGAEPGTTIKVDQGMGGTANNYVFEFKAPPLDSIKEIRDLIDQLIEKMNVTAMIRSEDLIKASRSGAQIETYDSKLEAFIRKKAISLENAEYQLWMIWHDWLGLTPSNDLKIEYNKMYGNKGIQNGITEVMGLIDLYDKYVSRFAETQNTDTPIAPEGFHIMLNPETGEQRQVPNDGPEHEQLMAEGWTHPEDMPVVQSEQDDDMYEIEEAIKQRFKQILMASYTENSR